MFNISKISGYAYGILNFLRVCNIIALLSVQVATWVMIVMSAINNNFFLLDVMANFSLFLLAVFFMFTEMQFIKMFKRWLKVNINLFSDDSNFVFLGFAMMFLSVMVLGQLNKPAYWFDTLGSAWWRLIIASGILSMFFGVVNIIASIIFRDPSRGVNSRQIRSQGSLALNGPTKDVYSEHNSTQMYDDDYSNKEASKPNPLKRITQVFTKSRKPQISAPMPNETSRSYDEESHRDRRNSDASRWDDDQQTNVAEPPLIHHPAYQGGNNSRRYSAAHMSRFTSYGGDRHDGSGKAF